MTDMVPTRPPSARSRDSAIGQYKHKRSVTDFGLGLLAPVLGGKFLDRYHLRGPFNRGLKFGVTRVFSAAGASTRQFKKIQGVGKPPTRLEPSTADYFDLTPDDDQKMIVETVNEFAEEFLRPAARDADTAAASPPELIAKAAELGITAISCTPSYPAVLERTLAEQFPGLSPRDLGLRLGLFGGEAGLDDPAFRGRLESVWGFKARNANYGVSDVFCNFAGQCEHQTDLHFMGLDVLWPELIEPESGDVLPWREGTTGELVLTHLERECQPLVRFRTGDIVALTGLDRCACGRHAPRFRVIGRSDDMVVVRGLNVFPTTVAATLGSFSELSAEYRIRLAGGGPYDILPIEVELTAGQASSTGLVEAIAAKIKREIGVTATITLLPSGSLPRTEGKTRRVIREGGVS